MPNIGYHTRLYSDPTKKITGGSFGGSHDIDTMNRLVNAHFTVIIKPSGYPVFVDREGREVMLYTTVDVASTKKGVEAIKQYRIAKAAQEAIDDERYEAEKEKIESLMDGMSTDEIIRRLS